MIALAQSAAPAEFSWYVLLALIAGFLGSLGVYLAIVRRWTTRRHWVAMSDWARQNGFHLRETDQDALPPPLTNLPELDPQIQLSLSKDQTTLLQMDTDSTPASRSPERAARWHLLVRRIESAWPPTGLRPVAHQTSLLDIFSLSSFPSLGEVGRFVIFSSDSIVARSLADSSIGALLPPDVGLLLHGQYLLLDFSTRPFDRLEFGRMIALADSLLAHLPAGVSRDSREKNHEEEIGARDKGPGASKKK